MIRLAKYAVASLGFVPAMVFAQTTQAIYKSVDESGRVTYANSPIKGGTKVNLEPLTILESIPVAANASTKANTTETRAIAVAKVTSVPSSNIVALAVPVASAVTATPIAMPVTPSPPVKTTSLDNSNGNSEQQRRADIRSRTLGDEIQAEEKSLAAARAALIEEQGRSGDIRTMRSAYATTTASVTAQKPLISPVIRAAIERHFERIRNLQDEVATHESNVAAMREELAAKKS